MTTNERAAEIVLEWYRPGDVLYNLRIEDLVAYAMTTARREALEEACRAICDGCRNGEPARLHRNGRLEHKDGWCAAWVVRALINREAQNGGRE